MGNFRSVRKIYRGWCRCRQACTEGMTKMFKWPVVGVVTLMVVISSDALSQQTLQGFDSAGQFQQALSAVDTIKYRKKLQCVIAIANRALCECLSRNLPVDTYPRSYASIAKQENEYEQLSAADKKIVGQCVGDVSYK
jgi:hypothetical protein